MDENIKPEWMAQLKGSKSGRAALDRIERLNKDVDGLMELLRREKARVEVLEGVLDRVDYALENIWAIDRDRLRHLIAEAATEQEDSDGN